MKSSMPGLVVPYIIYEIVTDDSRSSIDVLPQSEFVKIATFRTQFDIIRLLQIWGNQATLEHIQEQLQFDSGIRHFSTNILDQAPGTKYCLGGASLQNPSLISDLL